MNNKKAYRKIILSKSNGQEYKNYHRTMTGCISTESRHMDNTKNSNGLLL